MYKIGSSYDQLEEALTNAEGDLAQVDAVLSQYNADLAIEYEEGKLYTVGEAVVDVTDKGIVTTWQDANDFLNSYNTEQYLPFDPDEQFNKDFWDNPSELYHGTLQGRLDSIMKEGLSPRNETRGMSNRGTPSAVFTSTDWDEANHYYETVLKIDTEAMKAELPPTSLPFAGRESDIVEGEGKETLANALGYEDYSYDFEQGMSPNTVILYGAIPPKYLSVAKEDTNPSKRWHLGSKTAAIVGNGWAIWEGHVLLNPKTTCHADWFERLGIPYSGPEFDRIPRGNYYIDRDKEKIYLWTDAETNPEAPERVIGFKGFEMRFAPPEVIAEIKKKHPYARDYEVVDKVTAEPGTAWGSIFSSASKTAGVGGKGWAIWQGKVLLNPTRSAHVDWFSDLGLPSFGPEFDRIPRGNYVLDDDSRTIQIWTDSEEVPEDPASALGMTWWGYRRFEMPFAPQEVVDEIKRKHPRATDYEVVDEMGPGDHQYFSASKNAAGVLDSPAFRAWFDGSKVVDQQGNPLRCYHGTRAGEDFEEFSTEGPPANAAGEPMSSGSGHDPTAYLGAHFAQEPQVANQFALGTGWQRYRYDEDAKPRVIPVYLSIRNPKDFGVERSLRRFIYQGKLNGYPEDLLYRAMEADEIGHDEDEDQSEEEKQWFQRYDTDDSFRMEQNRWLFERFTPEEGEDDLLHEAAHDLAMQAHGRLEAAGHDGIRYANEVEGGISWIVFSPSQAKSALGNAGAFDPSNPSMVASKQAAGEWWRRWRKTFLLKKGTVLYHGTAQDFSADELRTPAWFSTSESVAEYFESWHGGEGEGQRILRFQVVKPIRLPRVDSIEDLDKLSDMFGFPRPQSGMDYADDLARVLPGWVIPHQYPDGDDILLSDSDSIRPMDEGVPEGREEPPQALGTTLERKDGAFQRVAFPRNQVIALQDALDRKLFGPVYHGTVPEAREAIDTEGFKVFEGEAATGPIRNGFEGNRGEYALGLPPPIHFLGYGVYFTTSKGAAKKFNGNSERGLKTYYLDVPRLETINFNASHTMMKWWLANGYPRDIAKADRVLGTKIMTMELRKKYDAVFHKGGGFRTIDMGPQVVVFDPSRIYLVDPNLAKPGDIGSKLVRKADGMKGTLISKRSIPQEIADQYWGGERNFLYVRWARGGADYNVLPSQVEFVQPKTAAGTAMWPPYEEWIDGFHPYLFNEAAERGDDNIEESEELRRLYDDFVRTFSSWKFPLTIWRAVKIGDIEGLETEGVGVAWSFRENMAIPYGGMGGETHVLRAKVPASSIDWDMTMELNLYGGEDEVRLIEGAPVQLEGYNIKGKWFPLKKRLTASDDRPISPLPALSFVKDARFTPSKYLLISVDTQKLDREWSKDIGFYLAPGSKENHIGDRYARFQTWLQEHPGAPIEAPFVSWKMYPTPETGGVGFLDGRHRFAVLRDMGYKTVNIVIEDKQLPYFKPLMAHKTAAEQSMPKEFVTTNNLKTLT